MSRNATVPFFSVVVATYNRVPLLERALSSLQRQQWQDWEAIIVDDGSTDGTAELLQRFCTHDPRMRCYRTVHQGAGAARRYGIARARGQFVTFLDSDDEYLPQHLQLRAELLQQHPYIEVLHGGVRILGSPYVPDRHNPQRLIHLAECVIGGTLVVRRELFRRIPYPALPFADDAAWYEQACRAGVCIAWVSFPTYCYDRTVADSLCTQRGLLLTEAAP